MPATDGITAPLRHALFPRIWLAEGAAAEIIFDWADAISVRDYLTDTPEYELIWVRDVAGKIVIPAANRYPLRLKTL
jgi:hypothetical protein